MISNEVTSMKTEWLIELLLQRLTEKNVNPIKPGWPLCMSYKKIKQKQPNTQLYQLPKPETKKESFKLNKKLWHNTTLELSFFVYKRIGNRKQRGTLIDINQNIKNDTNITFNWQSQAVKRTFNLPKPPTNFCRIQGSKSKQFGSDHYPPTINKTKQNIIPRTSKTNANILQKLQQFRT